MRVFTKSVGGIAATQVDAEQAIGAVCCEVPDCYRMAYEQITMAGYPAGYLCAQHAREFLRLWDELRSEAA